MHPTLQTVVTEVFALLFGLFLWLWWRERQKNRGTSVHVEESHQNFGIDLAIVENERNRIASMTRVGKINEGEDEVTVAICLGGRTRVATFLDRDKVAGLMDDDGSLGKFLRDLRDAP